MSTKCMCRQCHALWTYYCISHTPHCRPTAAAWTHYTEVCDGNVFTLLEHRIYVFVPLDYWQIWQRTDLTSHLAWGLVACSAGDLKRVAFCAIRSRMHLSLWPPLLMHTVLQFWPIVSLLNLSQSTSFVSSGVTRMKIVDIFFIVYTINM